MAYQQQYDSNYRQPRQQQQQYYNQSPPQAGRQQAGYDHQYHDQQYDEQYDYGYDQGQYEQWDDGYYDQQQGRGWENGQQQHYQQQPQGGYSNANGQMRQGPQARRPLPRDQYEQQTYDDPAYQQPQERDPRATPMGRPSADMERRGTPRNDARGQPPPQQQGRGGTKLPGFDRSMMNPVMPKAVPQDNAFPTFPTQNPKSRPKAGSIDEAMQIMSLGDEEMQGRPRGPPQGRPSQERARPMGPPQARGPPPPRGRGYGPEMGRHDSGHSDGFGRGQQDPNRRPPPPQQRPPPLNMKDQRPLPRQRPGPASPSDQRFGPDTQRSMTLPQNMGSSARPYEHQQQWQEPGPVAGYHGPESQTYIPPRPSTASGTKNESYARQAQFEQVPPMPSGHSVQPQNFPQGQQAQFDRQDTLDNVYDDYYGNGTVDHRQSKASTIDMPNFDAIPDNAPSGRHRRGDSLEAHLSPTGPVGTARRMDVASARIPENSEAPRNNFYQQASRSRSQPDLNGQYAQENAVYEVPGDAPAVPAIPRTGSARPPPNGLPTGGPRGRGPPPRGMTMDSMQGRRPPDGGFPPHQQQNVDPRYAQQQPPVRRGYSDESAYSEPGPYAMRNGSPMAMGNQVPRPGTAAPAPGRMPSDPVARRPGTTQPSSPDALPSHPMPVRPGLMQQQNTLSPQPPGARQPPPPVRQYNTDPSPVGYANQQQSSLPPPKRSSVPHPVTHDELNRLRNTFKANPADATTGLQLAKKLVEAATVLADEGGTADTRTKNKNREKYIMDAHKTVKKLVSAGSPDAMFYLADCYGQGRLGLAVDTKEAFNLYQSAAKAGHPASAYRTAVCCEMGHEEGGGTRKDPAKAVQWYKRAALLGDTPAMYKMGMILLKGLLGTQVNLGEAINMLKRAADNADAENPHALHELALLYEADTGNQRIIRDEAYAAQLFQQAAALGYKFSQFRLGQAYEYGLLGCPIDARSSIGWYAKAAAQEEHQSELALSGWYLTGTQGILEQSDTEAYLWARKAACAEPPLPKAMFAMGYFTEVGIGCPRSLEEAKRWYGRAAAYKFPKAQERLEELKKGGAKVQRSRERLSRTNQKQHEENCVVM